MLIALIGVVSAAVGGAATAGFKYLVDRKTVSAEVKNVEAEARNREADVWKKVFESYSTRLDDLQKEMGSVKTEVAVLKAALDREEKRSDAAISYIRILRRWIGERYPHEDVPQVPDSLRNDV